jgi:hypothetical protein
MYLIIGIIALVVIVLVLLFEQRGDPCTLERQYAVGPAAASSLRREREGESV